MTGGSRAIYDGGYSQSGQGPYATDHTFERIQFKQATANNGKRRAAQQYYHLVVELYVDVGTQNPGEQFVKIAERKSAKMIVRGRSPGHYQTERRGSTSSGPGGSSGMGSYTGSQVLGGEYGPSSSLVSNPYSGAYEPRQGHYTTTRHPEIGIEPMMSSEDAKAIEAPKNYQYFPSPIYEGVEPRQGIEMYSHRNEPDTMLAAPSGVDSAISKVKHEYDHTLPSIYHAGPAYYSRNCNRFEGRATSAGYYPQPLSQSG
jgi:meiosis-specific transcription factor NDT80